MQKRGYSTVEIQTFFTKYDKDQDGVLNSKEKKSLYFDIKKAKSHIEDKFQKYSLLNEDQQKEENEQTNSALVHISIS